MSHGTYPAEADFKSLHLVNPQLRAYLQNPIANFTGEGLRLIREQMKSVIPEILPPSRASFTTRTIPGPPDNPDLQVVIVDPQPGGTGRPALLHMHGGGYVIGTARQFVPMLQRYADACGCVIVSVDYRLSPETRFPGALEDNYVGLRWLRDSAAELGVDPNRIGVGGESAGGGHAAALAIAARDRGEVPVAFQFLIYPMLDDRTGTSRKVSPYIGEFLWNSLCNEFGWSAYLGVPAGSAMVPAGSVPARVEDLSRLPPTYIGVGALDIFVEENLVFASRLIAAGVPVDMDVVSGAYHGFNTVVPDADVSMRFDEKIMAGLRRGLATTMSAAVSLDAS
jgi:acetyl esterase/lipase